MKVTGPWRAAHYLMAIALQVVALLVRLAFGTSAGETPGMVLFVLPVLPSAFFGGLGPGLTSTAVAGLLTDYFLLKPQGSLAITNPFELLQWCAMIGLGISASVTIDRLQSRRRQAEAAESAALKAREMFLLFIRQSPNAAAMFDRDLTYLVASDRWIAQYCGAVTDPIGQHFYAVTPEMPESWKNLHDETLRGKPFRAESLEWVRQDGSIVWISVAISPWTGPDGDIGGVIMSVDDITAQHRLAEELRRARDIAEATDRAKTALLAGVSHELRTPLNGVIGFSEALLGGIFGEFAHPRQREYVADIHAAGLHLLELINDILDTSALLGRKTILEERPLDMNEVIGNAVRYVQPVAEKAKVAVVVDAKRELPALLGDSRRILQILLNLLSNAVKFTNPGGEVVISARANPDGDFVVRVRDTGIGMTREQLEQIRSPFAPQYDSFVQNRKGAGLGLYLAEGLVALHGGTMTIASTPNVGTTVTIFFPSSRVVGTVPVAS